MSLAALYFVMALWLFSSIALFIWMKKTSHRGIGSDVILMVIAIVWPVVIMVFVTGFVILSFFQAFGRKDQRPEDLKHKRIKK